MTLSEKDTVSWEFVKEATDSMSGLLGMLTAACRIGDEREAMKVCTAWKKSIGREFPDLSERVPLKDFRKLYALFCDHVQNLITRAEGKP